ncbi:MAG TPA: hypothetical protein VMS84_14990 [Mycobacterium sp.]|jgi:hypothetical protein|nr:hypothetical protein [Mycobacterium sp.]
MNTNRNKLALRRQSIRALNADELRMAHGGDGGNGTGTGTGNGTGTGTGNGTGTGTRHNTKLQQVPTATHPKKVF